MTRRPEAAARSRAAFSRPGATPPDSGSAWSSGVPIFSSSRFAYFFAIAAAPCSRNESSASISPSFNFRFGMGNLLYFA